MPSGATTPPTPRPRSRSETPSAAPISWTRIADRLGGFGEIKSRDDQAAPAPLLQHLPLFGRLRLGIAALLAPRAILVPGARLLSAALIRHVRDASRPSVSHKASSFSHRSLPALTGPKARRVQYPRVPGPSDGILRAPYDQDFAWLLLREVGGPGAHPGRCPSLCGQRYGLFSRSAERLSKAGEHRQVGVKLDVLRRHACPHALWRQRPAAFLPVRIPTMVVVGCVGKSPHARTHARTRARARASLPSPRTRSPPSCAASHVPTPPRRHGPLPGAP